MFGFTKSNQQSKPVKTEPPRRAPKSGEAKRLAPWFFRGARDARK